VIAINTALATNIAIVAREILSPARSPRQNSIVLFTDTPLLRPQE
jgi:hypothetical protein